MPVTVGTRGSTPLQSHRQRAAVEKIGGPVEVSQLTEAGAEETRRRGPHSGRAAVDKVEGVHLWPAVKLRLDLLRVCVRGQLLAGTPHHQEQAVFFGLRHPELGGAHLTDLVHGGVRPHLQGLGCATTVQLVQRHPQVVLRKTDGQTDI